MALQSALPSCSTGIPVRAGPNSREGVSLESSWFLHFVAKEEILQPLLACTLVGTTHGFFSLPRSAVLFAPAFPKHNPGSLAQTVAAPQANSWELATTTSDLASPCESHYTGINSHSWALIPISGGRQSVQQGIEKQQHRNSLQIGITRAACAEMWPEWMSGETNHVFSSSGDLCPQL